jgi:catechol 2,3-dioxygenase
MNAAHSSPTPTAANGVPLCVGSYALVVQDLDRLTDFYAEALGLAVLERAADAVRLGMEGATLLELQRRPDAQPDDPATAGLFHTAFLIPTRKDLAEWYLHSQRIGLTITRTGDHLVNEAIYFEDPEGNGCECYADRAPETWEWDEAGHVNIDTGKPVDLASLNTESPRDRADWKPPAGLGIGHINLRVGDCAAAETFYCDVIGFDHTGRRHIEFGGRLSTITFMSSGRYHHHLAVNDFTSRGAGRRDPARSGLGWLALRCDASVDIEALQGRLRSAGMPVTRTAAGIETQDPWGTTVRVAAD